MKKALFILIVIIASALVSQAQTKKAVKGFSVNIESLAELNEIEWDKIPEIFENNAPNDSIAITVTCNIPEQCKSYNKEVKISGSFKITHSCLASEVNKAVKDLKKTSLALGELENKLNKK